MPTRRPRLAKAIASGSPTWPQPPTTTTSRSKVDGRGTISSAVTVLRREDAPASVRGGDLFSPQGRGESLPFVVPGSVPHRRAVAERWKSGTGRGVVVEELGTDWGTRADFGERLSISSGFRQPLLTLRFPGGSLSEQGSLSVDASAAGNWFEDGSRWWPQGPHHCRAETSCQGRCRQAVCLSTGVDENELGEGTQDVGAGAAPSGASPVPPTVALG